MKLFIFTISLFVFFVLTSSHGNFPTSLESQLQCGRESFKKIYVCDPDKILGTGDNEASQLEEIIKQIANESTCPCSSYFCDNKKAGGYKVVVAVAKQMFEDVITVDDDDAYDPKSMKQMLIRKRMKEASKVGDRLRKQWKVGACEEDVLLFYSHNDEVVYTMMGDVASKKLTPQLVNEIAERAIKRGFLKSPFNGIHSILMDYRAVFKDVYMRRNPRAGKVSPNSTPHSRALSPLSLLFLTAISSLLIFLK